MSKEPQVPVHKVVQEIANALTVSGGDASLSDESLRRAARAIRDRHDEKDLTTIADQLIVLAVRFHKAKARTAMVQMVALAALCVGSDRAGEVLETHGVKGGDAKALMTKSKKDTVGLGSALGAPKTKKNKPAPGGVGPKKRG